MRKKGGKRKERRGEKGRESMCYGRIYTCIFCMA